MDTDSFVLSFDANNQERTNFFKKTRMKLILADEINLMKFLILLTKTV